MDVVAWDAVFASEALPHGTWILTDFERMAPHALSAASQVRQVLLEAGCQVLNDPRRWLPRADLLRQAHAAGLNDFRVWRPAAGEWPDRFPVFLRRASGHAGSDTPLVEDPAEADQALAGALAKGFALADLLFIDYAGETVPGRDYFRKLSAYRTGAEVVRGISTHDRQWIAKAGVSGLATAEDYAVELHEMTDYPCESYVWKIFELAGLQFGRIDFGELRGRPQLWEVNSNPRFYAPFDHPKPDRIEAMRISWETLLTSLWGLARTPGPPVMMKKLLRIHRIELPENTGVLRVLHHV